MKASYCCQCVILAGMRKRSPPPYCPAGLPNHEQWVANTHTRRTRTQIFAITKLKSFHLSEISNETTRMNQCDICKKIIIIILS